MLENCLLHDGLRFKDQKISNVRYYGVDTVGVDGSLTKGFPEQPVVTDVGALERVNPQRNRLASDTNESEHIYQSTRKRYLDMHSKICPARGLDPAKEISQLAEYRLQQDMRLLQKLKQDGLSDNEVVHRNLTLAEARRNGLDANSQLLYNPSMILNR